MNKYNEETFNRLKDVLKNLADQPPKAITGNDVKAAIGDIFAALELRSGPLIVKKHRAGYYIRPVRKSAGGRCPLCVAVSMVTAAKEESGYSAEIIADAAEAILTSCRLLETACEVKVHGRRCVLLCPRQE